MNVQQLLKPATETHPVTATRSASPQGTSRPVSVVATGIGEILKMRVGCWQAPMHIGFSLPVSA
jgi:hypothetical protein